MEFTAAILAKTESEFKEKVERIRPLGLTLHVDIMDGIFVPNKCWSDPIKVQEIADYLPFEVHLMTKDPEHTAMIWLAAGAKRVWIHTEATGNELTIMRANPKLADRIGLVLNPDTPIARIMPIINDISAVIIMGVTPGASGQDFQEIALGKIRALKKLRPDLWIEVDGGVNLNNISEISEAGADAVASASALVDTPNPSLALAELKNKVE